MSVVGVLGGSGFYKFIDDLDTVKVDTPYGEASAPIALGKVGATEVAFLPRHGQTHQFPAHRVNYRANIWALHEVGVRRVIAPCAAGSLRRDIVPESCVVLEQIIDRTNGRADSYFNDDEVRHVSFADPYCPTLRDHLIEAATSVDIDARAGGTVVVIQGPRFSTRAESCWYRSMGGDVVNMTQYPETVLARELGMCFAGVALVTDFDSGVEHDASVGPVTMDQVFAVLARNVERTRSLLGAVLPKMSQAEACTCAVG